MPNELDLPLFEARKTEILGKSLDTLISNVELIGKKMNHSDLITFFRNKNTCQLPFPFKFFSKINEVF